MILEVAILNVKMGLSSKFEVNFSKAEKIIAAMDGYLSHELKKCVEEAPLRSPPEAGRLLSSRRAIAGSS